MIIYFKIKKTATTVHHSTPAHIPPRFGRIFRSVFRPTDIWISSMLTSFAIPTNDVINAPFFFFLSSQGRRRRASSAAPSNSKNAMLEHTIHVLRGAARTEVDGMDSAQVASCFQVRF